MKKFTANIFIIPNTHDVITDSNHHIEAMKHWNHKLARFGLPEFKVGDIPIQIWTTSPGVDSWNNHGCPSDVLEECLCAKEGPERYFPETFPASIFAGLKEGEKITIKGYYAEFELIARQLDYRYRSHGNFEEVFNKVTK